MINPLFPQGFDIFANTFLYGNVTALFGPFGTYDYAGPQALQQLFNFGNISFSRVQDLLHNASTSLTNHIRENGHENYTSPVLA